MKRLPLQTYQLDYADIKALSRNALAYSFLPGDKLFPDTAEATPVAACNSDRPASELSDGCEKFLAGNEKARMQWRLEERFRTFEAQY